MVKYILTSALSLVLLFSSVKADDCMRSNDPSMSPDLISTMLRPEEIRMLDSNPNESHVWLSPDVVSCLRAIPAGAAIPEALSGMKKYIESDYSAAPYEAASRAVEEAIEYYRCRGKEGMSYIESLEKYREALKSGAALILTKEEEVPTRRRSKCKRFCRLIVECLKVGNLCVSGNALIGGNLTVRGTTNTNNLNVTGTANVNNLNITGTVTGIPTPGIPGDLTLNSLAVNNNITFNNTGVNPLNVKGAVEPFIRNLRGIVQIIAGPAAIPFPGSGVGYTVGPVTPILSLGGLLTLGLSFDVTFNTPFTTDPTVVVSLETPSLLLGLLNNLIVRTSDVEADHFTVTVLTLDILGLTLSNLFGNTYIHFIAEAPVN